MSNTATQPCCAPVLTQVLSPDDAIALAERFKAIADPVRLQILNRLASAPDGLCVCDLVDGLDRSQPTVSHHLKILTTAGLVAREQRGRWVWCHLVVAQVEGLRNVLEPVR